MMDRFLLFFFSLLLVWEGNGQSVPLPNLFGPNPGINKMATYQLDNSGAKLNLGLSTQARVMYNFSNIPVPGTTTISDAEGYDFVRQRLRLATDIRYVDSTSNVQMGAYTQVEYRGAWGGSSPTYSDPRNTSPINNPHNFLQARGIRYGYLYLQWNQRTTFTTGILPLSDAFGGMLFDAEWDFNVGGLALGGPFLQKGKYRLALLNLLDELIDDGVLSTKDAYLIIAEQSYPFGSLKFNTSVYRINFPKSSASDKLNETWLGASLGRADEDALSWQGALILNTGDFKGEHTGLAASLKLDAPLGTGKLSFLGLMATGAENDHGANAFFTPHFLVSTAGYWAKTHIFTPAGPSDVNDFGLEIGNGGAGLKTLQLNFNFPISFPGMSANTYCAWYSAAKDRSNSKYMGVELGGWVHWQLNRFLHWDFGGAYAFMGKFYGPGAEDIFEFFSRLQFEW